MHMNNCAVLPLPVGTLDMVRELLHWRRGYPNSPFFKSGLEFERYVATFKFGYDTFLPNREKNPAELLPRLCHLYKDGVAACDRIDWAEAEMIVSATWARLEDADSAQTAVNL
jgi:hypothetical protein